MSNIFELCLADEYRDLNIVSLDECASYNRKSIQTYITKSGHTFDSFTQEPFYGTRFPIPAINPGDKLHCYIITTASTGYYACTSTKVLNHESFSDWSLDEEIIVHKCTIHYHKSWISNISFSYESGDNSSTNILGFAYVLETAPNLIEKCLGSKEAKNITYIPITAVVEPNDQYYPLVNHKFFDGLEVDAIDYTVTWGPGLGPSNGYTFKKADLVTVWILQSKEDNKDASFVIVGDCEQAVTDSGSIESAYLPDEIILRKWVFEIPFDNANIAFFSDDGINNIARVFGMGLSVKKPITILDEQGNVNLETIIVLRNDFGKKSTSFEGPTYTLAVGEIGLHYIFDESENVVKVIAKAGDGKTDWNSLPIIGADDSKYEEIATEIEHLQGNLTTVWSSIYNISSSQSILSSALNAESASRRNQDDLINAKIGNVPESNNLFDMFVALGNSIPSLTSQLFNDAEYQTLSEVNDLINIAVNNANHLSKKIVDSVDTANNTVTVDGVTEAAEANVIYLVNANIEAADSYYEYTLIGSTLTLIGSTSVDLSEYVKTADLPVVKGTESAGTVIQVSPDGINTPKAKNRGAVAFGRGTIASGQFSFTEGAYNATTQRENTGINYDNIGSESNPELQDGSFAHAEGQGTAASGIASHTEGIKTQATARASHAEGYATIASGDRSHAEGTSTQAIGVYSHAEGYEAITNGSAAHAEGTTTEANGESSHAEGHHAISNGVASHAEGHETEANGNYAHTEGHGTIADGESSHAEGVLTKTSGTREEIGIEDSSTDIGTQATAKGAHAEGWLTRAVKPASHSEGHKTFAQGDAAHAEGAKTQALNGSAHAEGFRTIASGEGAHAEGGAFKETNGTWTVTTASGTFSHAEGEGSLASGNRGHAEGYKTVASGDSSHAEGFTSKATASHAHAEGQATEASGKRSHSEGDSTVAYGYASHAEGYKTKSYGAGTHSTGYLTQAGIDFNEWLTINNLTQYSGTDNAKLLEGCFKEAQARDKESTWLTKTPDGLSSKVSVILENLGLTSNATALYESARKSLGALAAGEGTIAKEKGQAVFGTYNEVVSDAKFIVGNGTDADHRSNLLTVGTDEQGDYMKLRNNLVLTSAMRLVLNGGAF